MGLIARRCGFHVEQKGLKDQRREQRGVGEIIFEVLRRVESTHGSISGSIIMLIQTSMKKSKKGTFAKKLMRIH